MKTRNGTGRIAALLICMCMFCSLTCAPAFAEDTGEVTEEFLELSEVQVPEETPEIQPSGEAEEQEQDVENADAENTAAAASPEPEEDIRPDSTPEEENGLETESETDGDDSPAEEGDNPENANFQVDPAAIDPEEEPVARNAPSYFVSIPMTVCRIDTDAKTATLSIDVRCEDELLEGDRLELAFSSANDMMLSNGDLDSIEYVLRDSNGVSAPNNSIVATFTGAGSTELSLEVSGTPSYAGEYRDLLTFTVTFIPGDTEL